MLLIFHILILSEPIDQFIRNLVGIIIGRSTFNICILLHGIFHIYPVISPRRPYQARLRSWRADMGRGVIPGPTWNMPCNDLFISYFQAEEMRIYVKHNVNMNILKFSIFISQILYVILIKILTKFQQPKKYSYHFSPLNICWMKIELTFGCRAHNIMILTGCNGPEGQYCWPRIYARANTETASS